MSNEIQAPTRGQFVPLSQVKTLEEGLSHPAFMKRLVAVCSKEVTPESVLSVARQAAGRTPALRQCNPLEVLGALVLLANMGLEANTPMGQAYLIPFGIRKPVNGEWKTVAYRLEVVIGYPGIIMLAYRSGMVTNIHADVVYEGDFFEHEYGSHSVLRHRSTGSRKREPIYAYCHASLTNGGQTFMVWPWEQVLEARNSSEAYKQALRAYNRDKNAPAWLKNPWVAHPHQMGAKTLVRALRPYLPQSRELARAVALEAASSRGADFSAVFDLPDALEVDASMLPEREIQMETEEEHNAANDGMAQGGAADEHRDTSAEPAGKYSLWHPDGTEVSSHSDLEEWAINFADLADNEGVESCRVANVDVFDEAMNHDRAIDILTSLSASHGVREDNGNAAASKADPAPGQEGSVADEGAPQASESQTDMFGENLPKTRSGNIDTNALIKTLQDELADCDLSGLADLRTKWRPVIDQFPRAKRLSALGIFSKAQERLEK